MALCTSQLICLAGVHFTYAKHPIQDGIFTTKFYLYILNLFLKLPFNY